MDMNEELMTTVVGSYPSVPGKKLLGSSYYDGSDPFHESLRRAVKDQLECGIDMVSDGQTRADMVSLFAQKLSGFRVKDRVELVNRIGYRDQITVEDQKRVKDLIQDNTLLKGIVTGPYTLVKSSDNRYYKKERKAVFDTAEALHKEAVELAEICDVVQVDEPLLSIDFPDHAKESVETVLDLECTTALHVCGDVSNIVDGLVELDVDILDHEFTSIPKLYERFDELDFPQRLAVGVVSTRPELEKVSTIMKRIEKAYDLFGPKTMIDPDCGLRNLDTDTAKSKLKNMVEAREMFLNG